MNGGNSMMKKFNRVKTILLDCDATLWIHRKDETKIIAKSLGIPLTEAFSKEYFFMIEQCCSYFEDKKVTVEEFTELISNNMPILLNYNISAEKFIETWFSVETSFANEDSIEFLHYLKARRYKIIILSDMFYDKQIQLLEKYEMMPYIDEIHTWDDAYMKKNPKSTSRIIVPGNESEYVIIGDSLHSDIAFANNSGINSIWYNPECKKNTTQFKPTVEIQCLLEVRKIL